MRLRSGMVVAVEFADHVEDGSIPIDFVVYGKLSEVNRKFLVIESWTYADPKIIRDNNVKYWTIVRSAIIKITQLVPKEGLKQ